MLELTKYFLKLGAFGFGGPVVLINHMHNDLVLERKWFSEKEYKEGLAFSQLSPGPMATQLALYLGWLKGRTLGATLTAVFFLLPSFLLVTIFAALYLKFGTHHWIQSLFYSVGAAVVGIIVKSAYHLARKTLRKDILLWVIFCATFILTVSTKVNLIWIFAVAGLISLFLRAPPTWKKTTHLMAIAPLCFVEGLQGPATFETIKKLGLYFTKVGTVVFGSGLTIVPFLYSGVVQDHHWLTERQFVDAIAIGMITPGPIVITSGFIGYLVAGPVGGLVAALGMFFPCYLFVVLVAPFYRRFVGNSQVQAFVYGITAAAIGAVAGAAIILGLKAITDFPTLVIALATLLLLAWKKIPEPLIILAAGLVGIALKGV